MRIEMQRALHTTKEAVGKTVRQHSIGFACATAVVLLPAGAALGVSGTRDAFDGDKINKKFQEEILGYDLPSQRELNKILKDDAKAIGIAGSEESEIINVQEPEKLLRGEDLQKRWEKGYSIAMREHFKGFFRALVGFGVFLTGAGLGVYAYGTNSEKNMEKH